MVSFRRKRNVNVMRVGVKIVGTVLGLYASGLMLNIIGDVMINTSSQFYDGLTLIGWTVGTPTAVNASLTFKCQTAITNNLTDSVGTGSADQNSLTSTSGSGILAVIGLLAIVWVVFEFVDIQM